MKYQYGAFGTKIIREKHGITQTESFRLDPRMTCNLTRASLARNTTTSLLSYGRTFLQKLNKEKLQAVLKKGVPIQ
jgi:hypothetical protein